jgi:hypothetical protein
VFNTRGGRLVRTAFANGFGEAIFRSRISAEDIFCATGAPFTKNVYDHIPKAGLGHNSTPV